MKAHPTRDLALINAAGYLRSFGVGLMGVVLKVCYADSESAEELIGEGKRLEADVVFRVRRRQVLTFPK